MRVSKFLLFLLIATANTGAEPVAAPFTGVNTPDTQTKVCDYQVELNPTTDSLLEPGSIGYIKKKPGMALFLSLLPGGGQFYTDNYLKGIIIGGVQLYFGGGTIYLHLKAEEAKREKYESWKWYYDWYSNQRNNFLWWDALVWVVSMSDAYVSAHFYKFREQGKLKLDTGYRLLGSGCGATVCLTKTF